MADIEEIVDGLSSKQKLDRDKNLNRLILAIPNYEPTFVDCLLSALIAVAKQTNGTWESYHGILQAMNALFSHESSSLIDDQHMKEIREAAENHLTHSEVRVRLAAGEVLGSLCTRDNCFTYVQLKPKLLHLIQSNLERGPEDAEFGEADLYESSSALERLNLQSRERRNSGDAAQIFHDTAGWRYLETSMKCLESLIRGCGDKFLAFIDQELLELLFTSLGHTNRFVRETGFGVCAVLVSCGATAEGEDPAQGKPMIVYGDQVAKRLALGLADNWSQVRLAASEATRKFLVTLPVGARERFFPTLLPRICLNRYYMAEGVRLYSQETWRQVTGSDGRILVERYIDDIVPYYVEATRADNHAVREAACECVAELALKMPEAALRPHVGPLLRALKVCFSDDSWPVRDVACLACGNFIFCFPDEGAAEIEELLPLFLDNLQDNIPSVRQGGAAALLSIVKTYPDRVLPRLRQWIIDGLKGVENQPSEARRYSGLDAAPATYGVVKQKRDNDFEAHSNKQMYSCGSLAPKMGRGGCSDCRFRRPSELWERADGCLYLVGELGSVPSFGEVAAQLLPEVAVACSRRHFAAHLTLIETLCKIVPGLAKGLGKRLYKANLHLFFDAIFYALESENALAASAASRCLNQVAQLVGPNILRGRVEQFNPSYLGALDANSFIAPL